MKNSANTLIISDDIYQLLFVKKPVFIAVLEKYMNDKRYLELKRCFKMWHIGQRVAARLLKNKEKEKVE